MRISICIPSYNRPEELERLLQTVDCDPTSVEIVVCEDAAPLRAQVREKVRAFASRSPYSVVYKENAKNLGYDGNLRCLIEAASGEYVLFMGDDDKFMPGALDKYIGFLSSNRNAGYVLRSYCAEHADGSLEPFKYCKATTTFRPSLETCAFLFKRTVSIAGVTFKRSSVLGLATDKFDGTLLYQLYLVLEVAYKEPSVYCEIPVAVATQTFRLDKPQFGAAAKESKFQPGRVTQDNSIRFMQGFFEVAGAFDKRHDVDLSKLIAADLSKYSYPILSIQRKNGLRDFLKYSVRLSKETPVSGTWHYYFYTAALACLGEAACDKVIIWIKQRVGHTPSL